MKRNDVSLEREFFCVHYGIIFSYWRYMHVVYRDLDHIFGAHYVSLRYGFFSSQKHFTRFPRITGKKNGKKNTTNSSKRPFALGNLLQLIYTEFNR